MEVDEVVTIELPCLYKLFAAIADICCHMVFVLVLWNYIVGAFEGSQRIAALLINIFGSLLKILLTCTLACTVWSASAFRKCLLLIMQIVYCAYLITLTTCMGLGIYNGRSDLLGVTTGNSNMDGFSVPEFALALTGTILTSILVLVTDRQIFRRY